MAGGGLENETVAFMQAIGLGDQIKAPKSKARSVDTRGAKSKSSPSNTQGKVPKSSARPVDSRLKLKTNARSKDNEVEKVHAKTNARKWGKETKEKIKQTSSASDISDVLPKDAKPKEITWMSIKQTLNSLSIILPDGSKWFEAITDFDSLDMTNHRVSKTNLDLAVRHCEAAFQTELSTHKKLKHSSASSEDEKWINEVIRSGTLSDKVAALALRIQKSPIHELETLDTLISMALKKEQRTAQLALEALKDLLLHDLLPPRRLKTFLSRPLGHPDISLQTALLFWYEAQLISRVEQIATALDQGMKSSVDYFKNKCMDMASEWIISKPEQEARLLAMLVNKLGDPSAKICSKCISLLGNVIYRHPVMKSVLAKEVRQLISRPNLPPRAVYNGVIFLSQLPLSTADAEFSTQLVDCYVSLFEKAVTQDTLGSKLLGALLSGINRAYPYLTSTDTLGSHIDALFRIVHNSAFSSATQALTLISHLALGADEKSHEGNGLRGKKQSKNRGKTVAKDEVEKPGDENSLVSRFYRALYAKLLSEEVSNLPLSISLSPSHHNLSLIRLIGRFLPDPITLSSSTCCTEVLKEILWN
jgi:ribosome biogenesis protein MAK21